MFGASGQAIMGSDPNAFKEKITLNLEDVVLHEQKLFNILENLRNNQNASLACEDWWDLTETADLFSLMFRQLLKDIQFRQQMV